MSTPRRSFLKWLAGLAGATGVSQLKADPLPPTTTASPPDTATIGGTAQHGTGDEDLIKGDFDLIVVGGGYSGTACAISAARNGVKVALVHERSMLGGNASSEVRLYPEGNDAVQPWVKESGIHEEVHVEERTRNHVYYREGLMNCHWDLVLYEWVIREKNLTLFLNAHFHRVKMKDKSTIQSITAIQLGTEKTFELSAPLFVDATGDGVLGYRAGAEFRWGREAKSEYNESLAQDVADEQTMGNTLFFRAVNLGKPVTFKRPEWAAEYPTEADLTSRSHTNLEAGHWWIEVGAPYHPIKDNEMIRHENLRQLLGVWDHVKNKGNHGAENYALEFVGFWPYKREARRILGDTVLSQEHVQNPKQLDDAVANGAWGCDLHTPGGILNRHERPYIPPHNANFEKWGTLPYGIGLRSLYSRNVTNLMMVGRPISASYIAFCSSRVLSTGCVVGQAVGAAAGLCKKYGVLPREVAKAHMKECQQVLLRQDLWVPGVENEDPADLARQATASASSDAVLEFAGPKTNHELNCPRAQLFPVSGDRIDTVSLWLESKLAKDVEMEVGLRHAPQVWDFRSDQDLATAKATVPAGHSGWVEFKFDAKVEPRKLYWVHAPEMKKVYWRGVPIVAEEAYAGPIGASSAQKLGATRWEPLRNNWCLAVKVTPESRPYTADNVNHGTHRPDRWTNIWISEAKLPQHIELAWPKPTGFNTVILTFDTNTGRRANEAFFRYPECVKEYELQALVGGQWKTVATESDNYQRRRTHKFDRVEAEKLRLNVLATNGAPTARVYEIRVYDET